MPVAAIAMIATPEYWMNGTAASSATTMQVQTGVCRLGDTRDSGLDIGRVLSRHMPKHSRMVDAMIDKQQTKMAAETTSRQTEANPELKFAWMICAGARPRPPLAATAPRGHPGDATRLPSMD